MRKVCIFMITVIFSFILVAAPLYAFTTEEGDKVAITASVGDDLYVVGRTITVDSTVTVEGDLIAAGGQVDINGEVSEDLIAAGGVLNIKGDVGDDARISGGIISISGDIEDDMLVAGGRITISKNTSIGGDLVAGGGTLEIKGEIAGDALLSGTAIIISGKIDGNVKIQDVDELTITGSAEIAGDVDYESAESVKISDDALIGGEVKGTIADKKKDYDIMGKTPLALFTATYIGGKIISFLSLFVLGIILLLVMPGFFNKFNGRMRTTLGNCAGAGAIMVFGMPVGIMVVFFLSILLFITIVGSGLGIIAISSNIMLTILYMLIIYTSTVFLSFLVGRMILFKTKLNMDKYGVKVLAFLIGLVILAVIYSIPFVGWLIKFAGVLFGCGAISLVLKDLIFKAKKV